VDASTADTIVTVPRALERAPLARRRRCSAPGPGLRRDALRRSRVRQERWSGRGETEQRELATMPVTRASFSWRR